MYALIDIFNIYLLEFLIIMEKLQDVLKISDLLVNNIGVLSVSEIWKFYYEVVYKL